MNTRDILKLPDPIIAKYCTMCEQQQRNIIDRLQAMSLLLYLEFDDFWWGDFYMGFYKKARVIKCKPFLVSKRG